MRYLYAFSLLATLLLAPALGMLIAQATETSKTEKTAMGAKNETAKAGEPLNYEKWIDVKVFSSDGEEVGKVSKVLLGTDDKLKGINMSSGGYFGMFQKTVMIENIQMTKFDNKIELKLSREEVRKLLEVDDKKTDNK